MYKVALTLALLLCVQLAFSCDQADKNACRNEGCDCMRRERPDLTGACEDIWDSHSIFKCRLQYMECISQAGCVPQAPGK